jgi:hypothetical protein
LSLVVVVVRARSVVVALVALAESAPAAPATRAEMEATAKLATLGSTGQAGSARRVVAAARLRGPAGRRVLQERPVWVVTAVPAHPHLAVVVVAAGITVVVAAAVPPGRAIAVVAEVAPATGPATRSSALRPGLRP